MKFLSALFAPAARRLASLQALPDDPQSAERLVTEQFSSVRRNTPAMMAASICNALALVMGLAGSRHFPAAALWGAAVAALCGNVLWRHRRRRAHRGASSPPSVVCRRAVVNGLALGALWAVVPIFFWQDTTAGEELVIAGLTAGMLFGGAFALSSAPLAASGFATPIALAASLRLLMVGDAPHALLAVMILVYALALLRSVFEHSAQMRARVLDQIGAETQARTDSLTGLPNRRSFNDAMEREFARITRAHGSFLLLCVDLDNFKVINDRLGHPAGDDLLAQAANRMREALRATDLVARLGGDEFAILATDVQIDEDAREIARRIVACYDRPFVLEEREVFSSASVGGALAPRDGADLRELVKSADIALYRAKHHGGCWRLFEPSNGEEAREARALELDLRRAIFTSQMSLVFQPFLNVETGELSGCEALLRWRHPERGEISPATFIPLAERIGLIHDIGMFVIDQACAAATQLPSDFRVAVNVSPLQLRRADFAERLLRALENAGLAPSRIEIEITETALLADDAASDAAIRMLSRAGVSISLDDFGSGYSALTYLRKLPLDKVKIDRSFVNDVLTQQDSAAIVRGVTRMAAELGMTIVAEGVETVEQLAFLRQIGCYEAQGYLISRPAPLEQIKTVVQHWRPALLAVDDEVRISA